MSTEKPEKWTGSQASESSTDSSPTGRMEREIAGMQALVETSAGCELVINKKRITSDVSRVELDQFVDDHHRLRVRLRERGKVSAESDFSDPTTYTDLLGKSLSLTIKPEGGLVDAAKELGFIGVVTKIDLQNSIDGLNTVVIEAHSPTISMDGGRHNAFYHDQRASDIIGAILRNHPVSLGKVDASQGTLSFSVQYRETDYEYVMRLAGAAGLFAHYDGKEFRVTKAGTTDVETLVWRETLGAFTLGLGTAAAEFNSQIYNYEQKKTYTQDSKSIPQQAALSQVSKISPDASKEIYAESGFSTFVKEVGDAQSLDQALQLERSRSLGRMITCRGQSVIPSVAPGHCVKITGMNRIDATYWVLSIRHVFDESGKYHNAFSCSPVDIAFPQYRSARPAITNMQMAVVVDNNDPDKFGRIKVQFPWCESDETPWVRLLTPHAGPDRGWVCLPEIGDEVLVGYEQGSPDHPIALGALYNKESSPPGDAVDDVNNVKMFITRTGNSLVFKDTDGSEEVHLITKDGKNKITMKVGGPTVIESEGAINIKGGGDITIEGANITLKSDGKIEMKSGMDTKIEASANLDTKAGAQLQIQGMTVTVKGTPIQLN
jgi:type VI secretion system secreted protein VgrG